MQQLVYRSRATHGLGADEIFRIIETSARNNPGRDVTGFLVFARDQFIQLVEGPAASLDALLAVLERDPRHCDIEMLERRSIAARSFPKWRMERVSVVGGNLDKLTGSLATAGVPSHVIGKILGQLQTKRAA
ncbi:BLUF domain-containing protein [Qipengyuania sp. MTN3-11]|uniref:BLUF domain-containing protein n=1 Tax=Qipengyuania sp. MTN3-11 TaxID=3056557 RepID=UPI0036F29128